MYSFHETGVNMTNYMEMDRGQFPCVNNEIVTTIQCNYITDTKDKVMHVNLGKTSFNAKFTKHLVWLYYNISYYSVNVLP